MLRAASGRTLPPFRTSGNMFSSRRLTISTLVLFIFALGSRPLPAKNTPKPDKQLTMAIEAEHSGDFDTALSLIARERVIASSRLQGEANVLIFPNLDAGSTALQLTRVIADALPVGPILIGPAKPAHVLTPSVTARGIVNMTAIAAVEAAAG